MHIDGIDGLQRSIAVRAKTEMAAILARAAVGRSRGDAVVSMAHAYRAWALQHPGRYAAMQRSGCGDADDRPRASPPCRSPLMSWPDSGCAVTMP